ncbi:NAD-dependent epimerase/dehydratase family protein [Chloroflexi bacterium TSY]|nr:NAD-dependent epimerase/dehydratase family protein [Chloroflexi bacterium TSY]
MTGAAGFVGSRLSELLLSQGHQVTGIDAFIPYYPRSLKEQNLVNLVNHPNFIFHEVDFRTDELIPYVEDVEVIFHLAAQAGLLRSWSEFDSYMTCNVQATQRLLAAITSETSVVQHFIHISTSSVYGRFATGNEDSPLAPVSPYGITKLAAENLCWAYAAKDDLPVTVLRLYSVYGPGQRPDMGYNIFIRSILDGKMITVFGDGEDSRSNTYVDDCVRGIALAMEHRDKSIGETFNIGGGEEVTVNQVLSMLEELSGKEVKTISGPKRPGDQRRTMADTTKAKELLGYIPTTSVRDGLRVQLEWQRKINT